MTNEALRIGNSVFYSYSLRSLMWCGEYTSQMSNSSRVLAYFGGEEVDFLLSFVLFFGDETCDG